MPNFIFTLKAPLETCIKRDEQRDWSYGKETTEAIYNLVAKFDYGIIVETDKKTIDEVIEEIKNHIIKLAT